MENNRHKLHKFTQMYILKQSLYNLVKISVIRGDYFLNHK